MIKVVSNNSFNWGDESLGSLIKVSSRGLVGEDRRNFEKRAASDLLSKVAQIKTKPGEELVHLIALGDTEHYGPNRNGDGFSKKACEDYHDYFVKEARVYRNHKNTDPQKSYGVVKASAYNEDMHRVELIVALNTTKEAAAANDGLVADKEMEKMAKDGNFAVSMACRVPFDVCSCCGNKAKTREDYCKDVKDGGHCKAGGLDKHLGKMASVNGEIKQLYADNTKPYFFDISHVHVPADRTAYTSGFLTKSASAVVGGTELASLYGIPTQTRSDSFFTVPVDGNYENALRMLKDATADFHSGELWKKANPYCAVIDGSAIKEAEVLWQHSTPAVTRAMFEQHICLTPTQFIQWETGLPFEKAAQVGEVIGPLSNDAFVDILVSNDRYNPYLQGTSTNSHLRTWCNQQKCARWDYGKGMQKQAAVNSITGFPELQLSREAVYSLSDDAAAKEYSHRFALYKAAFVLSQPKNVQRSIAELLIGRDYMSR